MPPHNVTILDINQTSMMVAWEEPTMPNGILGPYNVCILSRIPFMVDMYVCRYMTLCMLILSQVSYQSGVINTDEEQPIMTYLKFASVGARQSSTYLADHCSTAS